MNQAPPPPALAYAFAPIAEAAPGNRVSRAVQSAAAEALLRALPLRVGSTASKAHARGMAAAAAAAAGRVGIDLEYMDSGRDIAGIAAWLLGGEDRAEISGELTAYRVFTFREAYFKCEGRWPSRALLHEVKAATGAAPWRTPDGLTAMHELVAERFMLTLVWSAPLLPQRVLL